MSGHKKIIFDEYEESLKIYKIGFDNSSLNKYQLGLLAKLFAFWGYSEKKSKEELIKFCNNHVVGFNDIMYRNLLNDVIKQSQKYRLRTGNVEIYINESELDIIKKAPIKLGKILFVMLVLAKYARDYSTRIIKRREYKENSFQKPTSNIARLAKVSSSKVSLSEYRNWLAEQNDYAHPVEGYKDTWRINIVDETSASAIMVENLNDIISYFPIFCEKCGKIIKKPKKKSLLCEDCYVEDLRQRNLLAVQKIRKK